jgi:hypothetical protein
LNLKPSDVCNIGVCPESTVNEDAQIPPRH